jgi:hypothetical protein
MNLKCFSLQTDFSMTLFDGTRTLFEYLRLSLRRVSEFLVERETLFGFSIL